MPNEPVKQGNIVTLLGAYENYNSKPDKAEAHIKAIRIVKEHGRVAVDSNKGIVAAQVTDYVVNTGNGLIVMPAKDFESYWEPNEKAYEDVEKQAAP